MLTGTPLDLTPFGSLLSGMGTAYWALALLCAGLAAWFIREWPAKVVATLLILGGFALPVLLHVKKQGQENDTAKAKLDESMALFQERCKTAGEKIHRTVENVEGVVWMKWREPISNAENFANQFKLNDPYGSDCGGVACVERLLRLNVDVARFPQVAAQHRTGYRFVESVDPKDGHRYRYVGAMKLSPSWTPEGVRKLKSETGRDPPTSSFVFSHERQSIEHFTALYGITWDDVSTREDREHWIAGGSLKVVDLKTNEVIAERIGYMIDSGQGSEEGFRSPWSMARRTACPSFAGGEKSWPNSETALFVSKVLQLPKEE